MTTARFSTLLIGAGLALASELGSARVAAQEIKLTGPIGGGPLEGSPAVMHMRLYRDKRFEIAPGASFTLLDEYQRTILFGARLNYNLTDWLAVGVFGAYGAIKTRTGLSDEIQKVMDYRGCRDKNTGESILPVADCQLTAVNLGPKFADQLGSLDWIFAPQITGVPFRGKLALFQSVYLDTDLYFFAGPAFVGLKERKDCEIDCDRPAKFERRSRVAIAPTFGLGLTFYANSWSALGFEWRALPFAWNTGGFDTRGADPNGNFPDNKIDSQDRRFHFNQMLTVSYNFYYPLDYRISE